MSRYGAPDPVCTRREGTVRLVVRSRTHDLGGFCVRRVLPAPERRMVGPFIFLDEMGPADFGPGGGIDVRPHPHIGLATVTYLFDGRILHRDSLGTEQLIEPGAVNLMTAGRGIVHSERPPESGSDRGQHLHGLQIWMALPDELQDADPAFVHFPADRIPALVDGENRTDVVIGRYGGVVSPVPVAARTLLLIMRLAEGATVEVPTEFEERAVYVIDGRATVNGCMLGRGDMGVLDRGAVYLSAESDTRLAALGGEPFGRRRIWWNFVHSRRERIEQAKSDWREGRFPPVPGDAEAFIPLPPD
jgi:hypothetical protein